MTKYVLVYHSTGDMPTDPAEVDATMATWGAWYGSMGDALVDGGNPFAERRLIDRDKSVGPAGGDLSGYTVIQAADFDAAVGIAKGCPILETGTVEVCEAVDMG